MNEYYALYDARYQSVYEAGADRWGHDPNDPELTRALTEWVQKYSLSGKHVIEYAAGEGAGGYVLSSLGCRYTGVELSKAAVKKAEALLAPFKNARLLVMDMVKERAEESFYDAAFDCMGIHMLITDEHRRKYLKNVFSALKSGAPALFFHECHTPDAYSGPVSSLADWVKITGTDYSAPEERSIGQSGKTVSLPRLPARPKNKRDYISEFEEAGFTVDEFIDLGDSQKCLYAATISVHKP